MRLRDSFLCAAAIAAMSAASATAVSAQAQTAGTRFGVEAAYADHFNLGVGAFVKFHLAELSGKPLTGRATFDYYFPGDYFGVSQTFFQISGDALYDVSANGNVKPYVGAGLVYSHYSLSDQDCGIYCDEFSNGGIGLDILGGLNFMANSKLMPFVEIKLGLGGDLGAYSGSEFVLKGGVHF